MNKLIKLNTVPITIEKIGKILYNSKKDVNMIIPNRHLDVSKIL